MWFVATMLLINLSVLATGKLNYCGVKMCGYTNAHTFCQYPDGAGPQCIGYVENKLSVEEKIRLVIRLNKRRAAVANGQLKGFPAAGDMLKLQWVEELAREAQLWADQCEPPSIPEKKDLCRDLYAVSVGQCVASVVGEAPGLKPESMVDIWYMQSMFYKGNVSSYDPPINKRFNFYGDFAQLVYSKTYMVGCGRSRFMVSSSGRLRTVERLVCNFAPRGPTAGGPLWTVGSSGSACPPRSLPDVDVPSLCTLQNELDGPREQVNTLPLEENVLLDTINEINNNKSLQFLASFDEIYLTKVAIATIENVVTEPINYNSLQRRSLTEHEDVLIDNIDQVTKNGYEQQNNIVSSETYSLTTSTKPARKVIYVGRPKTYNFSDLNAYEEQPKNDYDDSVRDKNHKQWEQLEAYYDFYEVTKETTSESETRPNDVTDPTKNASVTFTQTENDLTDLAFLTSKKIVQNPKLYYVENKMQSPEENTISTDETISGVTELLQTLNSSNNYNLNNDNVTADSNDTDALIEEYLSDPETVMRLREELARMERGMASSEQGTAAPSTRAEKVRRALKDGIPYTEPVTNNNLYHPYYQSNYSDHVPKMHNEGLQGTNKSYNNPVVNMVLRYMPYLNNYKDSLMQNTGSSSNSLIVNYSVLLLIFCINIVFKFV